MRSEKAIEDKIASLKWDVDKLKSGADKVKEKYAKKAELISQIEVSTAECEITVKILTKDVERCMSNLNELMSSKANEVSQELLDIKNKILNFSSIIS